MKLPDFKTKPLTEFAFIFREGAAYLQSPFSESIPNPVIETLSFECDGEDAHSCERRQKRTGNAKRGPLGQYALLHCHRPGKAAFRIP